MTGDFDGLAEADEVVAELEDEAVLAGKPDGLAKVDGLPEEETDPQLTNPDRMTAPIQIANTFFIRVIIPFRERHKADKACQVIDFLIFYLDFIATAIFRAVMGPRPLIRYTV